MNVNGKSQLWARILLYAGGIVTSGNTNKNEGRPEERMGLGHLEPAGFVANGARPAPQRLLRLAQCFVSRQLLPGLEKLRNQIACRSAVHAPVGNQQRIRSRTHERARQPRKSASCYGFAALSGGVTGR